MKKNNLIILFSLLLFKLSAVADIALPKIENLQETKYYFANVDSFANYTFYVKKNANDKTYRIKQSSAFLLKDNSKIGEEQIEVWAVRNSDKQKSNTFVLKRVKPAIEHGGTTAHIAIMLSFDIKNNLNYKQVVMKPECYKRNYIVPIIPFTFTPTNSLLLLVSIISMLILFSLAIYKPVFRRMKYA